MAPHRTGPLKGLRVVELAGIGPAPHVAMLLADMGAEVLRIDRVGGDRLPDPVSDRGRQGIGVDLKTAEGQAFCFDAAAHADVLIEGFRPGVMERLGLGPEPLLARNPRLIYGRITGWGQEGPLALSAGHDINYIALTGALAAIGRPREPAVPPLNLVGDFGGGSMFLTVGILAALWERERSGRGQVVDAAIIDGVASLMSLFAGLLPDGRLSLERDQNILGGAAPYYRCYICADGHEVAVGAIEPKFFAELMTGLGLEAHVPDQNRRERWPALHRLLEETFASKPQAHWLRLFEGGDACLTPVLTFDEAKTHPHAMARGIYGEAQGMNQATPAPRFSRTPGAVADAEDPLTLMARWRGAPPQ